MKERKRCLKCGETGRLKTYSGTTGTYHNDCHGTVIKESLFELWLTNEEVTLLNTIQKFVLKLKLQ